jgi:hypothetical protein
MEKTYQLKMWSNWLEELLESVTDFVKTFQTIPNFIRLNSHSKSQLEYMLKVSPIGKEIETLEDGIKGNDYENPKLGYLTIAQNCTLEFLLKENLADKKYTLGFDEKYVDEMSELAYEEPLENSKAEQVKIISENEVLINYVP